MFLRIQTGIVAAIVAIQPLAGGPIVAPKAQSARVASAAFLTQTLAQPGASAHHTMPLVTAQLKTQFPGIIGTQVEEDPVAAMQNLRATLKALWSHLAVSDPRANDAHVLLLIGNPDLNTFVAAGRWWLQSAHKPSIVLSGGRGRGKVPLAQRTLAHYGDRLTEDQRKLVEEAARNRQSVPIESDVMAIILEQEGVPHDTITYEREPSNDTKGNFIQSAQAIAEATAGEASPTVALGTWGWLLRRASLTAQTIWARAGYGPWTAAPLLLKEPDWDHMSGNDLIAAAGYILGFPNEVADRFSSEGLRLNRASEMQGLRSRNNTNLPDGLSLTSEEEAAETAAIAAFAFVLQTVHLVADLTTEGVRIAAEDAASELLLFASPSPSAPHGPAPLVLRTNA